jgi:hypothetical protein
MAAAQTAIRISGVFGEPTVLHELTAAQQGFCPRCGARHVGNVFSFGCGLELPDMIDDCRTCRRCGYTWAVRRDRLPRERGGTPVFWPGAPRDGTGQTFHFVHDWTRADEDPDPSRPRSPRWWKEAVIRVLAERVAEYESLGVIEIEPAELDGLRVGTCTYCGVETMVVLHLCVERSGDEPQGVVGTALEDSGWQCADCAAAGRCGRPKEAPGP